MGQNLLTVGNGVLLMVLMIATVTDVRSNKIPNWLTFSAAIIGLGLNFINGGSAGLLSSVAGLFAGMGLFIVLYALGGMGAGDVKLMGAVGAMVGPHMVFWAAVYTAILGGVYALGLLLFHPRLREKRTSIRQALKGFIYTRKFFYNKPVPEPNAPKLCYGVAIAIGTIAAVIIKSV